MYENESEFQAGQLGCEKGIDSAKGLREGGRKEDLQQGIDNHKRFLSRLDWTGLTWR